MSLERTVVDEKEESDGTNAPEVGSVHEGWREKGREENLSQVASAPEVEPERSAPPQERRRPGEKERVCTSCGECCRSFGVRVPPPDDISSACLLLWLTYHSVTLATVHKGEVWWVYTRTRCQELLPNGLCAIYSTRPDLCRSYSSKWCEVNRPAGGELIEMKDSVSYLRILQECRPKLFNRLVGRGYVPEKLMQEVARCATVDSQRNVPVGRVPVGRKRG